MYIVVSGSTGLIGEALCRRLMDHGHRVGRLVRADSRFQAPQGTWSQWNPNSGQIDAAFLEHADVVIHLAGESITGLWTDKKRQRIINSRVDGTALLAKTITTLVNRPKLFLCASGIGIYGDRPNETLDETSDLGGGFLAEVAKRWEAAAQPAKDAGIPTAHMRLGMVLSDAGGALKAMLPIFSLGLGGKLSRGDHYWSWISLRDVLGAISFLINRNDTDGIYNFTAPLPVTNQQFTQTLGRVLKRPTILPVPETLLTLVAGDMAAELLLASQRVVPARLEDIGYHHEHPDLESALRDIL